MLMYTNMKRARKAERRDLGNMPTPVGEGIHRPVPHVDVMDMIDKALADNGLVVDKRDIYITDGTDYTKEPEIIGQKSTDRLIALERQDHVAYATIGKSYKPIKRYPRVPDGRMAFTLELEPFNGFEALGLIPCLSGMNAHDKSSSLKFFTGALEMICTNGLMAITGEWIMGRKHTTNISVAAEVERLMGNMKESIRSTQTFKRKMLDVKLTDEAARSFMVLAARKGAVASSTQ
jgi:hypothetical protein